MTLKNLNKIIFNALAISALFLGIFRHDVGEEPYLKLAQEKESDCFEFMHYEQNQYFTDTTFLSDGKMIYYQWNCDSTWLTYENNKKHIIKSCDELDPIMCSRLGLCFVDEYPDYLLFVYEWISGCCVDPDLVFLDKVTAEEIKRVPRELYVMANYADKTYAVYFSDTTYTNLIFHHFETNIISNYKFDENNVDSSARAHKVLQISELFSDFELNEDTLSFNFKNAVGASQEISFKVE